MCPKTATAGSCLHMPHLQDAGDCGLWRQRSPWPAQLRRDSSGQHGGQAMQGLRVALRPQCSRAVRVTLEQGFEHQLELGPAGRLMGISEPPYLT